MFRPRYRMSRKRILTVAGAALLVVAAIGAITAFTAASVASSVTPNKQSAALANPNSPFATDAHLDPTRTAYLSFLATTYVDLATNAARATTGPPTPTPLPSEAPSFQRTGIISGPLPIGDDRVFRNDATIENYWRAFTSPYGPYMFVVAAGVRQDDPQQGFVGVALYQHNALESLNKSPTPTKHGNVHITAVNGSLVTLVAADGTVFTFDDTTFTFK
ncbi:MAG: hypothetical protein ACYDAR_16200 [Thermomicrobiales bacterium]